MDAYRFSGISVSHAARSSRGKWLPFAEMAERVLPKRRPGKDWRVHVTQHDESVCTMAYPKDWLNSQKALLDLVFCTVWVYMMLTYIYSITLVVLLDKKTYKSCRRVCMRPLALLDFGRRSNFVIFSLSNSEIFSNSMIFNFFFRARSSS